MSIVTDFNKYEGNKEEFFSLHKAEIIEYLKEHSGDVDLLNAMPKEMLEYSYDALINYMIESSNDIQGSCDAVQALLNTNIALDKDNLTEDILDSIEFLYGITDIAQKSELKTIKDTLLKVMDSINSVHDENEKVDILIKLLEHPYMDLFLSEEINRKITEYASKNLSRDSKEQLITRVLDSSEEKEPDGNSHLFSIAQVITLIASSTGDEEYTKDVINRSVEVLPQDYLRSFMPALLTIKDDKYCIDFIYNNAVLPEEVVENVPLVVRKKKEFDRFLEDYCQTKTSRLLMISKLKNKRLASYYSKEFEFRKLLDSMDEAEPFYIGLPEKLRYGVEFEVEGLNPKEALLVFGKQEFSDWDVKNEDSLPYGFEVTNSRPFTDGKELGKIRRMADVLTEIGVSETYECGGHIHFDYGYFEDDGTGGKRSAINLAMIWKHAEEILYKISNAPNDPSRKTIGNVAGKIDITAEEFDTLDLSDSAVQDSLIERLKKNRSRGINFENIHGEDKNTIEFRASNGTIDKEVLTQNIKLFGALMQVSKDMTLNPEKYEAILSRFKDPKQSEREKLEALLDLLFKSKDDKEIYRQRWDSVKDEPVYDEVADSEDKTFVRGNYTLRDFARKQVHAVDAKDMTCFVNCMHIAMRARAEEVK